MNPPLVSIIIPVYNAEKYLSETLDSLVKQKYQNIEIILVDDGSIDQSLSIAKEYAKSHKFIKIYSQKNSGAQVARNKGFELSTGQYIQYFDSDDVMHPDKISSQMAAIEQLGFQKDIVMTGKYINFYGSINNGKYKEQLINKNYDDPLLFLKDAWENSEYVIGQSWLISRKIHSKIGQWNESITKNQDGEFFTRIAYHAKKIIFVKESLVYYRQCNPDSLSTISSFSAICSHLDTYDLYADLVKNDIEKYALQKAIATLYSNIYEQYHTIDKKIKNEVLAKINQLGYDKPLIKFKPSCNWIIQIFGIDMGLRIRRFLLMFYRRIKNF